MPRFAIIVWTVLILVGIFGWFENIIKIVHVINDPISLMLCLRIVGIFAAPLGAILGFL